MRNLGQSSRRAYIRELKEVVEKADVVLEVLDARDPLGSRAEAVEELITRRGKKLVVVLNKVRRPGGFGGGCGPLPAFLHWSSASRNV